jgi:thioredoxin reductase
MEDHARSSLTLAGEAEVAVVGAGYAGLSASLVLRRHRRDVLLFDGGPPRNHAAREVHGVLGIDDAPAAAVIAAGGEQVERLGTRIERCRISDVERDDDDAAWVLHAEDGRRWRAARLLLATGVRDRRPDIARFDDFYGRSVHVCPHCDAYEWRDRRIAVISWNEATRDFCEKVSHWSDRVTVVTDGRQPELDAAAYADLAEMGIAVRTGDVERFEGEDGQLRALVFADGTELPCDAAFFSIGEDFQTQLAERLGCQLNEAGAIVVDNDLRTTVEGVWAAGDVAGDSQFVPVALAQGVKAAVAIHFSLAEG